MKLERKTQQILPLRQFLLRMIKYLLLASVLIVFSLGLGIMGYRILGHLSWIDSLHMASMILAGMGPVADMQTDSAKLFSSFYALYSGLVFLSLTAVILAPVIHRLLHVLHVEDEEE